MNEEKCCPDELTRLREMVAKLHPRVLRLLAKGREFIVIGVHEPYFKSVYEVIRETEQHTRTWTDQDEERFARAIITWHNLKLERAAANETPTFAHSALPRKERLSTSGKEA